MGAFATGVAVISAARAGGRMSGLTANSLTSVSLTPPLLLWCLGQVCERYELFATADVWGVTILGGADEALARRFSRLHTETIEPAESDTLVGAPVLRAGVAHFACRTRERHEGGDHLIIVGEVIGFRTEPGAALTFYRGQYGRADDPREGDE
jgi:3-hydroxy-9,10-secoandrosta-1,3,5(10)-triene-9,17-dione monooxygenase reductase component